MMSGQRNGGRSSGPAAVRLDQHAVRCGCPSKELVAFELVLDTFADLLGVCLDLVGLAFRLQSVIVGCIAGSFLGLAAKVFRRVTDLVSEAHGSGLLSFPSINRALSQYAKLAYYFKPLALGVLFLVGAGR